MLRVVNELATHAEGAQVVGVAMQGVAARKLETGTGIPTHTLVAYMKERRTKGDMKRVVVFDEASMLDSRNAAKFFGYCEYYGDKVVLVGDMNQLCPIKAGNVFERLVKESEGTGTLITMHENFRQRDEDLRNAVTRAKEGDMKQSLDILQQKGWVTEIEKVDKRMDTVAAHYSPDTLIITSTLASRDDLNERIRTQLIASRVLDSGTERIYPKTWRDEDGIVQTSEIKLCKDEIITFTQNEYETLDVRNGERARIIDLGEKHVTVRFEDGREMPINVEQYSAFEYGYALTTYKAQGQTYDQVIVESDTSTPSLLDMRNQYVHITRARDRVGVYTDDYDDLQYLAGVRSYAYDTLGEAEYTTEDAVAAEAHIQITIECEKAGIPLPVRQLQKEKTEREHEQPTYEIDMDM